MMDILLLKAGRIGIPLRVTLLHSSLLTGHDIINTEPFSSRREELDLTT